jgi:hypothetical protein
MPQENRLARAEAQATTAKEPQQDNQGSKRGTYRVPVVDSEEDGADALGGMVCTSSSEAA